MKRVQEIRKSHFASNIRARRKSLGLTQEDLAHNIGVHINTIKDIERGISEGQPDTRAAISDFFECNVWELFQPPQADSEIKDKGKAELIGSILLSLAAMNEDELRLIGAKLFSFK